MELTELLNQIDAVKVNADENLHNTDYRTRLSRELKKNTAKKDLAQLVSTYKTEVTKRVAKIFLTGTTTEGSAKFVDLLKKEKLTVFTPSSVYDNIAASVNTKLSKGGLYSTPAFLQLCDTCRGLSEHFMVFPKVPPKNVGTDTIIRNMSELTDIVKNAVRFAYGDTLAKAYTHEQVFKEALNTHFTDNVLCVVFTNPTKEERNSLADSLFPEGVTFDVDLENEDPGRSHALKLYRKLHETFKNTKTTTTTTQN